MFRFGPLVITNLAVTKIAVTNITPSSATISWTTNFNATTLVNYGTTTAYGSTATGAANVTTHSVTLAGLSPNTLYYFKVSSTALGNTATQTGSFLTSRQTAPHLVVSAYKFTRSGSDLFVDITLSNTGTATAQNIKITRATLGAKTSSGLPVAFPTIAAGGMFTVVHALRFNSADFPSGTRTVLSGSGTYNGGSFSASMRVSVP